MDTDENGWHTEEQIAFALQQTEHGISVVEIFRITEVTEQNFNH